MLQSILISDRRAAAVRAAMHPAPALPLDRRQPAGLTAAGPRPASVLGF